MHEYFRANNPPIAVVDLTPSKTFKTFSNIGKVANLAQFFFPVLATFLGQFTDILVNCHTHPPPLIAGVS